MNLEALDRRIKRLEDIEAIRQLKARYCEICDDNHNPDLITTIFTEDGIWEASGIARAEGHDEIRTLFKQFQVSINYSQHMVQNPIIEVAGDAASGRWYFFGPFTFSGAHSKKPDQARWQAARYQEQYRRVDGEWKIKHLLVAGPVMSARYEKGWAG